MVPINSNSATQLLFINFFLLVGLILVLKVKNKNTSPCRRDHDAHILPPGPKPWPIFGCLFALFNKEPTFRWLHAQMEARNADILCVRFGRTNVITVRSPEIAREFLRRQDAIFCSRPTCLSADLTSRGYLTSALSPVGDQWKKMRSILTTDVLSAARYRWLHGKRAEEADRLVSFLYNRSGSLVSLRVTTQRFAMKVMMNMIFGGSVFQNCDEETEHVGALFTILQFLYSFCVSDYLPCLRGVLDVDGHEKAIRQALASVSKIHDREIDRRIKQWDYGLKTDPEDLLDVLIHLKNADDGSSLLSPEEIKAQVMEMMLATIDNPSNATEWSLAEMLNQPQLLEKATEELDRVVGKDRLVQESDVPQLNYIKACIKEAFRLHPVAAFNLPHVSTTDANVAGFFIPKGSHILVSRVGLGRNPNVWPEPLKYIPERHINKDGSEVVLADNELRMISFSTGRRGCPAILWGSTITVMLMARLLQGFTWNLPHNSSRIELKEATNGLVLAEPLVAIAKPRMKKDIYSYFEQ